jgi:alcohol dehydrogenase
MTSSSASEMMNSSAKTSSFAVAGQRPSKTAITEAAFDYRPTTRVVFGPGSLARLGELVRELGGQRVLLVTDPGLKAAGHPQRAGQSLTQAGLDVSIMDRVQENPTTEHVDFGLGFAKERQIDFIVAVGGGSSMDCAKGINFLLTNGGKMADYVGQGKAKQPMLPSIAVPTTAGTGSEAQSYALIADSVTHMKMACGDRKAAFRVAVLDPQVTISQPRKVTAITGIDALAHALESYVTTRQNRLAQTFAKEAWSLLEPNFGTVLSDPKNLEARGAMQLGAYFAGVAIENSMLGACHACANPLTAHFGLTHGIAIGVMLPHVIRWNASVVGELYRDLAHDVHLLDGNSDIAAESLALRITEFMSLAGLLTKLSLHGVDEGVLPVLAAEAAKQWTGQFNPRPTDEAAFLRLYEAAL